jgi:hypothetical protein
VQKGERISIQLIDASFKVLVSVRSGISPDASHADTDEEFLQRHLVFLSSGCRLVSMKQGFLGEMLSYS